MFAVPTAIAVTNPLGETVALLLAHVTTRPVSTLPFAARVTAVACVVWPGWRVDAPSDAVTVATGMACGACTVSDAVPVLVSLVAVIVAEPAAIAVTRPVGDTVATEVLLLVHATARPVSTLPAASRVTAVACVDWPVCTVAAPRETVTVATTTGPGGGGGGGVGADDTTNTVTSSL
jgi:hypothetical protein